VILTKLYVCAVVKEDWKIACRVQKKGKGRLANIEKIMQYFFYFKSAFNE
jgi:hypothetical protein